MTFREKLLKEHPDKINDLYPAEVVGCPYHYGYEADPGSTEDHCTNYFKYGHNCNNCWDREIPEDVDARKSLKALEKALDLHSLYENKKIPYDEPPPVEYVNTAEFAQPISHILDSGERRQFETGACRDIQEGKGRCDLMPLEVVANYICDDPETVDWVLWSIREFQKQGSVSYLYSAINHFDQIHWNNQYTMFLEVAKHFEEGAKKYGESNWQKGLPVNCYIDSAVRHYLKWLRGDKDEPHDRAFVWNLMCCIWEVDFSPRAKENSDVNHDN